MRIEQKTYVESIAKKLRKRLIKEGILSDDNLKIDKNTVEQIIEICGGELKRVNNKGEIKFTKTDTDRFEICYTDIENFMSILHELGHAFLEEDLEVGESVAYGGPSKYETSAWLFARNLVMPLDIFEKVAEENNYEVEKIANVFGTTYHPIMIRANELNIHS